MFDDVIEAMGTTDVEDVEYPVDPADVELVVEFVEEKKMSSFAVFPGAANPAGSGGSGKGVAGEKAGYAVGGGKVTADMLAPLEFVGFEEDVQEWVRRVRFRG